MVLTPPACILFVIDYAGQLEALLTEEKMHSIKLLKGKKHLIR